MSEVVTIDFETRSELDIRRVGAWRYAEHPSTEVLCLGYAFDDEEPSVWCRGDGLPNRLFNHVISGHAVEAHNAMFEMAVWEKVCVPRLGWPPLARSQMRDTMATCALRAIPLKLEKAAKALDLPQQKDMQGNALLHKMGVAKPRAPSKHDPRVWLDDFEFMPDLVAYCAQDVVTERALRKRIGAMPPGELSVWHLDQAINRRGVKIDLELCEAALTVAEQVERRLNAELSDLTRGEVGTASQRDRLLAWVKDHGADIDDLTADTLRTIDPEWPWEARRALEIRKVLSKTSGKKYATALECVCEDGRARGLLQYHATNTGRWGGRLIQPQNMRRPVLDHEIADLVETIKLRDAELLEAVYGDPFEVLADAVRGMFVASAGHEFVCGDFSGVEARILACLAGEDWKIDAFRRGEPIYERTADMVFGLPAGTVTKKTHPAERFVGKTCELAFGYEGGVGAWRSFDSSDRYTDEEVNGYKNAWRDRHPGVRDLWRGLEDACFRCVTSGQPHGYDGIEFERVGREWLTIRLLSGRRLWYYNPHIRERPMPWSTPENVDVRPQVFTWSQEAGQWLPSALYGGAITGHVVQATARDLLVWAMFRVTAAGMPIVLTVHDEILAEPERGRFTAGDLDEIMTELPRWAEGWPIAAEAWAGDRYRK